MGSLESTRQRRRRRVDNPSRCSDGPQKLSPSCQSSSSHDDDDSSSNAASNDHGTTIVVAKPPPRPQGKPGKRRRRRRHHHHGKHGSSVDANRDDLPFVWLFARVAMVVFAVGFGTHAAFWYAYDARHPTSSSPLSLEQNDDTDDNHGDSATTVDRKTEIVSNAVVGAALHLRHHATVVSNIDTVPKPPISAPPRIVPPNQYFADETVSSSYSNASMQWDAYAIAARYHSNQVNVAATRTTASTIMDSALFWQAAAGLRDDFVERYSSTNTIHEARTVLAHGMVVVPTTGIDTTKKADQVSLSSPPPLELQLTACRIVRAQQRRTTTKRSSTFYMAFGGYSVTAGRGNYFGQSFPMVLQQRLHTVFQLVGLQLHVVNAAMYVSTTHGMPVVDECTMGHCTYQRCVAYCTRLHSLEIFMFIFILFQWRVSVVSLWLLPTQFMGPQRQ
jgi:hypothetical protein